MNLNSRLFNSDLLYPHLGPPLAITAIESNLGAMIEGSQYGFSVLKEKGLYSIIEQTHFIQKESLVTPSSFSKADCSQDHPLAHWPIIQHLCEKIYNHFKKGLDQKAFSLLIGGDHAFSIGSISAVSAHVQEQGGRLGVIWIDAHGDLNTPYTSPTGRLHGMPLACLLGLTSPPLIPPHSTKIYPCDLVLLGVRDLDKQESQLIEALGVTCLNPYQMRQRGILNLIQYLLHHQLADCTHIHLSFDVDSIDPDIAPGVSTPAHQGLQNEEIQMLFKVIGSDPRLSSMDVMEFNPLNDKHDQTAKVILNLLHILLSSQHEAILASGLDPSLFHLEPVANLEINHLPETIR